MKNIFIAFSLILFLTQCTTQKTANIATNNHFKLDTLTYTDQQRNRKIPVAIFKPEAKGNNIPIIFSHGWGENKGGDNMVYSYLTEYLAQKGYFVVSIQHELPTDEMLAMTGNLRETRMPNWQRGSENIDYVLKQMKQQFPQLKYDQLVVMGHSNGGDMSVLFSHQHPKLVHKLISLDNRRMPLPRTSNPEVYTIRYNDYPADEGVLPTDQEKQQYQMIVDFSNINHGNMDNDASPAERKYMTEKVMSYLTRK